MSVRSSGLPAQNFLNPPPVPLVPTVTRIPRPSGVRANSSARALMIGATVLEPSMTIVPGGLAVPPGSRAPGGGAGVARVQAPTRSTTVNTPAKARMGFHERRSSTILPDGVRTSRRVVCDR